MQLLGAARYMQGPVFAVLVDVCRSIAGKGVLQQIIC